MSCFRQYAAMGMLVPIGLFSASAQLSAETGQDAAVGDMKALSRLEKGLWDVRERGSSPRDQRPARRYCVQDMSRLMQINHDGVSCQHYIVSDGADKASITYQCNGKGAGRTDLRVETPRLVQIETQGLAGGMPFSESLEARYVGRCR
ncbi:MAG: hypothetical protein E2598_12935 [Sphingobium sp.]|nr:hypothetical protein [Sphingobium sp.]